MEAFRRAATGLTPGTIARVIGRNEIRRRVSRSRQRSGRFEPRGTTMPRYAYVQSYTTNIPLSEGTIASGDRNTGRSGLSPASAEPCEVRKATRGLQARRKVKNGGITDVSKHLYSSSSRRRHGELPAVGYARYAVATLRFA